MADHARGERLRQLRRERGLSQEEVASALGVTAKTYGDWERGGGIRTPNARRLGRYFKVKPGELIEPEIASTAASPPPPEQLERIEAALVELRSVLADLCAALAATEPDPMRRLAERLAAESPNAVPGRRATAAASGEAAG